MSFFLNLDETQKSGNGMAVFKESELIMFSGYWKNSNSVFLECLVKIISMKNL